MAGHAVFINYRRDDTADACGRIYDRLVREFTSKAVFKDVDALPVGQDFGAYIVETLKECRVLLATIGPGWLSAKDDAGARRIDNPKDWVRVEIETALQTPGLQVIPILLNGAVMPAPTDLPEPLQFLAGLNAAIVRRDPDFHSDMDRLITALKEGALTGFVEVQAPTSGPAAATAMWEELKDSDDRERLTAFAESFPGTTEAFRARERMKMLRDRAKMIQEEAELYDPLSTFAALPALQAEAESESNPSKRRVLQERLDELKRSAESSLLRSIQALNAFMHKWPEHPNRAALQSRLKQLERREQEYKERRTRERSEQEAVSRERQEREARAERREQQRANFRRNWPAWLAAAFLLLVVVAVVAVFVMPMPNEGGATQPAEDEQFRTELPTDSASERPSTNDDRTEAPLAPDAPNSAQVDEAPEATEQTAEHETLGRASLPNLIEGTAFATVHVTALAGDRFQLRLHTPAGEETFDLEGRRWRFEATLERGIFRLVRISATGRSGARMRVELSERYSWPTAEDNDPIIHQLYQTVRDGARYSLVYDRILHAERTFGDTQ